MPTRKPDNQGNRNSKRLFRHSADDSSRHTPEKSSHKPLSKNSSDKAHGEST
jgi:hypothetical protein